MVILIAGLIVATALRSKQRDLAGVEIRFEQETAYGWVRVLDDHASGVRWLMSGGSTIGAEDLATGRGLFEYLQVVGLVPLFKTDGSSALLVGLGAGHLVNIYNRYGIVTDSIEIDPVIAMLAGQYFSFEESGDVMVGDARRRVQSLDRRYDFIIHDSFTGGAEPIHLMTREVFRELKARLNPGGIMVLNMVGLNETGALQPMEAVAATLDSVFAHRRTFVSFPESGLNDFLFFVSDLPLELDPSPRFREPVDWLLQREINLSGANERVVTDDFNPLETLNLGKAEAYRDVLVERIGRDRLFQ
jgi:SAM-dependent methyltransferase